MTDKAFETIEKVMERRGMTLNQRPLIMLRIFEESAKFRRWEK
ncbi:MAG: hypothetical protein R2769_13875 [Saprospiraceae bacterium]